MKKGHSGLTLVELMLVLSVLCVIASIGLPGVGRIVEKVAADSAMKEIVRAIALARQTAIIENTMVTLCRSRDGLHCQGKWHEGSIVFTDGNGDRMINEEDRLVYRFQPLQSQGELTFRSFGNKQYLQFNSRGFTNYQSGNFTFCPHDQNPALARQVVLNQSGRARMSRDENQDGIMEDSQGKPLDCT